MWRELLKIAGPVTAVLTGAENIKDFEKYDGADQYWAATMTVAGTGATVFVAAGITSPCSNYHN